MRFGEKIRIALELCSALIKDNSVEVNRRRIDAFSRLNVADVFGSKIELCEVERFVRAFIDIRQVAVANGEPVDLKRISRFQRVLPAFVLDRRWVLGFLDELPKVKMDFGIGDLKIADQSSKKERFPVHASMQTGYVGDGWIRVRRLINPQLLQIKGKPNRVKIKFLQPDRVTLEPSIHIPLDLAPQGL